MITVKAAGQNVEFKSFTFPGGEIGIKFDVPYYLKYDFKPYQITARLTNATEALSLAFIKDAIHRWALDTPIELFMPYIPYARQDRVCAHGESFSLKVFANYINSLKFNSVTSLDAHSNVAAGVFDNFLEIPQSAIINKWSEFTTKTINTKLVSPDAGSNKKVSEIAKYFGHPEFIRADKLRNLQTGEINETIVYCDDLKGTDVTIIDDICDGGATFIALAKMLKKKNAGRIHLYVTHGIFSRGVSNLLDNGIDEVWCTNSFTKVYEQKPNLHIYEV